MIPILLALSWMARQAYIIDEIIVFMRFPEIAMESHSDSKRMKKSRSDRTAINNRPAIPDDEIIATGSRTAANNHHQATTIPNWSPSVEARVQVFRALMRFAQLYRLSIDDTDVITKDSVLLISLVNTRIVHDSPIVNNQSTIASESSSGSNSSRYDA